MKQDSILEKLTNLETLIQQTDKPFSMNEACHHLNISKSFLYKLTHRREIPFFKPNGKKIYFLKTDLNNWLLRNRVSSNEELEQEAIDFVIQRGS